MKTILRNPVAVFFICMVLITTLFLTIPINLFDGEISFRMNGVAFTEKAKLSLSYFVGVGASKADLKDVTEFHLTATGYLLVGLFTIGFPLIVAFRVKIANRDRANKTNS